MDLVNAFRNLLQNTGTRSGSRSNSKSKTSSSDSAELSLSDMYREICSPLPALRDSSSQVELEPLGEHGGIGEVDVGDVAEVKNVAS